MLPRRALAALAAAAALAGAAPLAHAATGRPPIVALAGDNTFTFDAASGQRVVIRHAVTFSDLSEHNPDIAVVGGGAMAVFMLVRDGDHGSFYPGNTDSLTVIRDPQSVGDGLDIRAPKVPATEQTGQSCVAVGPVVVQCDPVYKDPHLGILQPGYYRVVGTGVRGTMTTRLTLHGLSGSVALTPATRVVGGITAYSSPLPFTDPGATVSAGSFRTMGGRGLLYDVMTVEQSAHVTQSYSECSYSGLTAALKPVAFLPDCPGGSTALQTPWIETSLADNRLSLGATEVAGTAGEYGRGFSVQASGTSTFVDGYGVALTFPR